MRYSTHMASVDECRQALEKVAARLAEVPPADRAEYFADRTMSVTVTDLNVTFATRLTGDDQVRETGPGDPPADIKISAPSDEVISLAQSPLNIARAWVAGRVKIDASVKDLFRLRRLL